MQRHTRTLPANEKCVAWEADPHFSSGDEQIPKTQVPWAEDVRQKRLVGICKTCTEIWQTRKQHLRPRSGSSFPQASPVRSIVRIKYRVLVHLANYSRDGESSRRIRYYVWTSAALYFLVLSLSLMVPLTVNMAMTISDRARSARDQRRLSTTIIRQR